MRSATSTSGRHERLGDPETLTRIAQYEMAFRMQTSVPDLVDFNKRRPSDARDCTVPTWSSPALSRRAACSRGDSSSAACACVQIMHRGWDSHSNLPNAISATSARDTDQGCAALIKDLKQRGLLDDTLVVWGGEFGRTVYSQGTLTRDNYGRDHHPRNFCMWMAGGGIKPGISYGETDDFSYNIVENPVHLNDLNATILHCLGIDHSRFTYKFQGLDQRLTGVEPAQVVKGILT